MNLEKNKTAEERMNALAYKWKEAEKTEGNRAAALKLREDFAAAAMDYYLKRYMNSTDTEQGETEYGIRVMKLSTAIDRYDSSAGPFSHYASSWLSNDFVGASTFDKMNKVTGGNTMVSIDAPLGESESDGTIGDVIPDTPKEDDKEDLYLEMVAAILSFRIRLKRDAETIFWHRLIFTELLALHSENGYDSSLHEREILSATLEDYLDYFLEGKARTISAIGETPLKEYGRVVPKCPAADAHSRHWTADGFPADVSAFYAYWYIGGEDMEYGDHRNNVTFRRQKFGQFMLDCGARL